MAEGGLFASPVFISSGVVGIMLLLTLKTQLASRKMAFQKKRSVTLHVPLPNLVPGSECSVARRSFHEDRYGVFWVI
jgi:hypothetical protein